MLFDPSGMRRLAALVVGSTLAAGLAAWATAATGSPTSSGELEAGSATLPPLPADIKARGRLTIAVKCDSPPFGSIVKWSKRRSRRRHRTAARAACVREEEPRHPHVCDHAGTRSGTHLRERRPRDRDLQLHARPGHAHRLLARVLQSDRTAARFPRLPGAVARGHRRQARGHDERVDLRPLAREVLPDGEDASRPTRSRAR